MNLPRRTSKSVEVNATLNKPVAALAIVPLNKSLTVTARKAYNVMLFLAQREGETGDAGYTAPLNSILRGFSGSNITTEAKRYIDQMATTKIEWKPLSEGEQWRLPLEKNEGAKLDRREEEVRVFHMLAEVRLYKKNGENWVTWFYPPTIKEQMLGPHRWARLELEIIAKLGTYTAVALYEICARYRDNPGGVTSRHPCQWWVTVLKGSEGSKQREWRKFKSEFVTPAIREINELSDIEIELIEFREGRAVADVQFAVRKKPALQLQQQEQQQPEPADVTHHVRATRLGFKDADIDAMIERYGAEPMGAALDAMERYMQGSSAQPILNKAAYLKTILAGQPGPAAKKITAPPAPDAPRLTTDADDRKAAAMTVVREQFMALPPAQQLEWTTRFRDALLQEGAATPSVVRRLDEGKWQSPLVTAMLLKFFGEQLHGARWVDLVLATSAST